MTRLRLAEELVVLECIVLELRLLTWLHLSGVGGSDGDDFIQRLGGLTETIKLLDESLAALCSHLVSALLVHHEFLTLSGITCFVKVRVSLTLHDS